MKKRDREPRTVVDRHCTTADDVRLWIKLRDKGDDRLLYAREQGKIIKIKRGGK